MSNRIPEAEWIWKDGEFIRWQDAQVHLLSLAVQFGSSVFEGMRCYQTPAGPAIFRVHDHMRRLLDSCRVYRIDVRWSIDQLVEASRAVVARNNFNACYMRPMVLRGYGPISMNPVDCPIDTYIPCWEWGTYLGEGALDRGVDVCISSWQRPEPNTFPTMAKAAGNYNNAQLIRMEAVANGYADAIALGPGGLVSEGSGQNVFLVRNDTLITPLLDGTSLHGITRDSIIVLARELGISIREQEVPREMLYTADEVFFTGTAAEVTPICSIDRIQIGAGKAGPVTKQLQKRFMQAVHGEGEDRYGWLTYVHAKAALKEEVA